MKHWIAGLAIMILVVSCQSTKEEFSGLTPMTHEQLKQKYVPGTKVRFTNMRGINGTTEYGENRSIQLIMDNGYSDKGVYSIEGNKFCSTYSSTYNGAKRCGTIYDVGNGRFRALNEKDEEEYRNLKWVK